MDAAPAAMVDLAGPLQGRELPRDHRLLLAQALVQALPWVADDPQVALHPVKVVHGSGDRALLSARSRLMLRVPRERAGALQSLTGHTLHVGECDVTTKFKVAATLRNV